MKPISLWDHQWTNTTPIARQIQFNISKSPGVSPSPGNSRTRGSGPATTASIDFIIKSDWPG